MDSFYLGFLGSFLDLTWGFLGLTWILLGSYLDLTWILLGSYLGLTWVLLGAALVPPLDRDRPDLAGGLPHLGRRGLLQLTSIWQEIFPNLAGGLP